MDVRDFHFDLPQELIAQEPAAERTGARLLRLCRDGGATSHHVFSDLPGLLRSGDLVVFNNTRVFPARLIGRRVPSGGAVECLLVAPSPAPVSDTVSEMVSDTVSEVVSDTVSEVVSDTVSGVVSDTVSEVVSDTVSGVVSDTVSGVVSDTVSEVVPDSVSEVVSDTVSDTGAETWEALVHPGQKLKPGARVVFEGAARLHGEILDWHHFGRRTIRFWTEDGRPVRDAVDAIGHVPLPPYIKRSDRAADAERYQTVFATRRGSVAAPTAGLHFSRELLDALHGRGIQTAGLTLHVGYGTFQPVRSTTVEAHHMEGERFAIPADTADAINSARREGRRVIAVGTTTTRTLESAGRAHGGSVVTGSGTTDLFIYPGFQFSVIDGMITNFHLPESSLLMLVCAFAGTDRVMSAYREAVDARYRFYSYGDAMLIL
jgi:S-adenosylmethionine:tRNA ribosyltransferase-isomerase